MEYDYLRREPTLSDVLRFVDGKMTEPEEVHWLLGGCDRNPVLDQAIRLFTLDQFPDEDELDSIEPDPAIVAAGRRNLTDLLNAPIVGIRLDESQAERLRNGGQVAVGVGGWAGASLVLSPTSDEAVRGTIEGLPSNIRPLGLAFTSIGAAKDEPESVTVRVEPEWPRDWVELAKRPAPSLQQLTWVPALASSLSTRKQTTLSAQPVEGHLLRITALPRGNEASRAVQITAVYEPKVKGAEVKVIDKVVLCSGEDRTRFEATWSIPLPSDAKRGRVEIVIRDLMLEELQLLSPEQASAALTEGPITAAPIYRTDNQGFACLLHKHLHLKKLKEAASAQPGQCVLVLRFARTEDWPKPDVLPATAEDVVVNSMERIKQDHALALRRQARSRGVRSPDDEEIVNDVLDDPQKITAMLSSPRHAELPYLRRTLRNEILRYWEKRRRRPQFPELTNDSGETLSAIDAISDHDAIQGLQHVLAQEECARLKSGVQNARTRRAEGTQP